LKDRDNELEKLNWNLIKSLGNDSYVIECEKYDVYVRTNSIIGSEDCLIFNLIDKTTFEHTTFRIVNQNPNSFKIFLKKTFPELWL
jgi:hypothetical protein